MAARAGGAHVVSQGRWKKTRKQCVAPCRAVADDMVLNKADARTRENGFLVCPVTMKKLRKIDTSTWLSESIKETYSSQKDGYLDLTLDKRVSGQGYEEMRGAGVETFRRPIVSWLYERGWRQSFSRAGFPGADEEFRQAMMYFEPVKGGRLMDLSCGSGIFTRRFVKSNAYEEIVAVDFSETMLRETRDRLETDGILLVRADVGRLPFTTESFQAIHAGAALHCWPQPLQAIAEISRILKPGGILVGSTFMGPLERINELFQFDNNVTEIVNGLYNIEKQFVAPSRRATTIRYWQEKEIIALINAAGLVDYQRVRRGQYIMFSARKPSMEEG